MDHPFANRNGWHTFLVIWVGQFISLIGTGMTRFALFIWAYQQTGDATTLALLGFFSFIGYVVVSPFAGMWVDRLDRKRVMLLGDIGAGLMTITMLLLLLSGGLHIWHLYVAETLTGVLEAFQLNAYSAAITTLAPPRQLTRMNGLRTLAINSSRILSPFLAGLLLPLVGLAGVMVMDVLTVLVALGALLLVQIPRPRPSAEGDAARGSWWHEMTFGFRYIFRQKGLRGILLIMVGINLFAAVTYFAILPTLVLARTGGDELALATVQGALGLGGVVGGVIVSVWGGPKRLIHGILAFAGVSFLFGDLMFAVGQTVVVLSLAAFIAAVFVPFIISSDQTLWQKKVAEDVQGRVFSARFALQDSAMAAGYLLAGPLADQLFEPAMAVGGSLASIFGGLVGTGHGAGMGLMFVFTAVLGMTISFAGYLFPAIRNVEDDLPDVTAPIDTVDVEAIAQPV